jgi:hypothetical protein
MGDGEKGLDADHRDRLKLQVVVRTAPGESQDLSPGIDLATGSAA